MKLSKPSDFKSRAQVFEHQVMQVVTIFERALQANMQHPQWPLVVGNVRMLLTDAAVKAACERYRALGWRVVQVWGGNTLAEFDLPEGA